MMTDQPSNSAHLSRRARVSTLAALLFVAFAGSAAAGVDLELRYWAASLDSTVGLDGADFDPELDLDGALDLGLEADDELEGRITLRPGLGFFLRAAYQNVSADGDTALTFSQIPVPVDVTSALDYEYGRLALGWQYANPSKSVRIGPFVEAKGVRGDATVTASALGLSAGLEEDFEAAALSAGALIELRPTPKLQLFLEGSVVVNQDDEDDFDLTDGEVGARYFFNDHVGVGGGYRILQIDGEIDGVTLDLDYDGVFASAVFTF